ncbi:MULTISPECIES: hypothetical protein [unclassified Kaistella]|uniref:hypothetical protein n=1 Tax=unclassified Kaistella TaxID=2762626 RepID=UPI0027347B87|nr:MULTISPECIES: hypothetical protein [unclassified Kaistella]MDP2454572.1 hypothetical protein [Kaistella sp. SH11-4b]MDP2457310.1 hypothetical protein [Kaistella sp. SH40-3]MDP2460070.1 hypothetical protein [Kaistella sp. SH19-2b]
MKGEGYDAVGISCDITDKNDVEKLVKFTAENGSFKALVHTAGVSGTVKDLKKYMILTWLPRKYWLTHFMI